MAQSTSFFTRNGPRVAWAQGEPATLDSVEHAESLGYYRAEVTRACYGSPPSGPGDSSADILRPPLSGPIACNTSSCGRDPSAASLHLRGDSSAELFFYGHFAPLR